MLKLARQRYCACFALPLGLAIRTPVEAPGPDLDLEDRYNPKASGDNLHLLTHDSRIASEFAAPDVCGERTFHVRAKSLVGFYPRDWVVARRVRERNQV